MPHPLFAVVYLAASVPSPPSPPPPQAPCITGDSAATFNIDFEKSRLQNNNLGGVGPGFNLSTTISRLAAGDYHTLGSLHVVQPENMRYVGAASGSFAIVNESNTVACNSVPPPHRPAIFAQFGVSSCDDFTDGMVTMTSLQIAQLTQPSAQLGDTRVSNVDMVVEVVGGGRAGDTTSSNPDDWTLQEDGLYITSDGGEQYNGLEGNFAQINLRGGRYVKLRTRFKYSCCVSNWCTLWCGAPRPPATAPSPRRLSCQPCP